LGCAGKPEREAPQVVLFENEARNRKNVFDKRCGSCHRVLTRTLGGLGKGNIGPNLSGLFSRYYPVTLSHDQRWTAEVLRRWLENPREIREYSQMQPVALKKDELGQLLAVFAVPAE